MTDTVDKIMALADQHAAYSANEMLQQASMSRSKLESAIREALDLGEPVAWVAGGIVYAMNTESLPSEVIADLCANPAANWTPLHARSKT